MIVKLVDGTSVQCEDEPMGGGAAGVTYFTRDRRSVVKLFKNPPPDMKRILEEVIGTFNCVGTDSYWQQFMSWPDGIVITPNLGVRMPCAPREMDKMTWVIFPKLYNRLPSQKKNWFNRLLMAIRLTRAIARMHRSGVAHSDLSPNNIMADPVKGTINLIDLDGLVVPGFLPPQVLGIQTISPQKFLSGKAHPSVPTDRHALAVLLHQLLLFRHPFRGPKVYSRDVEEDERLALGETAVFVDHPNDRSNRPQQAFWPTRLLGETMTSLFVRSFVQGLRDPSSRPTASEWETALVRLSDRIVGCGGKGCAEKYFPVTEGMSISCPWCRSPFSVPNGVPVLRLYSGDRHGKFHPESDYWIAGYPGKTIHSWHVRRGIEPGPTADSKTLAHITLERGKWFLQNLGLPEARLIENGSLSKKIPTGSKIELSEGLAFLSDLLPDGRMVYVQWIR